jgi:transcriptional regulator with XRE-family HTH domain
MDTATRLERTERGIPDNGERLRDWIRYQLRQHINPTTGKPYTQAAIAKETGASQPTVSRIFTGDLVNGRKAGRVRRLTAVVLGIEEVVLFGNVSVDSARTQGVGITEDDSNDG